MQRSPCRACQASVVWARTVNGKLQPFNATPERRVINAVLPPVTARAEKRSVISYDTTSGEHRSMVVDTWPMLGGVVGDEVDAYMPHHATCPRWKRK